jgi:hypothetical protein
MTHVDSPLAARRPALVETRTALPLWHRLSLYALYALTIAAVIYLVGEGWGYYRLPLTERPHHALHESFKPSGSIGHGIGIIGSLMMIVLLLYSMRKRARFMQQAGNIRYWLNYHIWLGVTGPTLVLFHTCFKFGGIVSISFWSMVAVVLSGVIGRYIYLQIPRSLSGHELSARDLSEMDRDLQTQLAEFHGMDERMLAEIQSVTGADQATKPGLAGLVTWMSGDLKLRGRLRTLRRDLRAAREVSARDIHRIVKLAKARATLRRRMAFLSQAHKLLHHWHVFHKPFAVVMLVIMVVHVIVTIMFGYRWIF